VALFDRTEMIQIMVSHKFLHERLILLHSYPKLLHFNPKVLHSNPKLLQTHPKLLQTHPKVLQSHPKVLQFYSKVLQSHPKTLQFYPKVLHFDADGLMFGVKGKKAKDICLHNLSFAFYLLVACLIYISIRIGFSSICLKVCRNFAPVAPSMTR